MLCLRLKYKFMRTFAFVHIRFIRSLSYDITMHCEYCDKWFNACDNADVYKWFSSTGHLIWHHFQISLNSSDGRPTTGGFSFFLCFLYKHIKILLKPKKKQKKVSRTIIKIKLKYKQTKQWRQNTMNFNRNFLYT